MANFLDLTTGMPALWAKIKSKFYTKAEVDALIPEKISDLTDVNITSIKSEDMLQYDNPSKTWVNKPEYVYGVVRINGTTATFTSITAQKIYNNRSKRFYVKDTTNDDIYTLSSCTYETQEKVIQAIFTNYSNGSLKQIVTSWSQITNTGTLSGTYSYRSVIDTNISSPTNKQILTYDGTSSKWVNSNLSIDCATTAEIEEMCDALGFYSVTIDTSDYQERSGNV